MDYGNTEIRDGFILRGGTGLTRVIDSERVAATHLIGGFPLAETQDNLMCGTVVWFRGNSRGAKVPRGVELGPELLGTQPRGFWSRGLPDDVLLTARIDRQKYISDDGRRFCVYALQIRNASHASVAVLVDTMVGVSVMRRAFTLSLDSLTHVTIYPTDPRQGYMHVRP